MDNDDLVAYYNCTIGGKMYLIDDIFLLLDKNNSKENQEKGMFLASKIKSINSFIKPLSNNGDKTWNNCAKILCKKSDRELSPYLTDLFFWIRDLSVPGAKFIFERLKLYSSDYYWNVCFDACLTIAKQTKDFQWNKNLIELDKGFYEYEDNSISVDNEIESNLVSDIDIVMSMLHCYNNDEIQKVGIAKGKEIKTINAFIMPKERGWNGYVWENCAKILYEKPDSELFPYLSRLFEWIEDLNWDGALTILERLKMFSKTKYFNEIKKSAITFATLCNKKMWRKNLGEI